MPKKLPKCKFLYHKEHFHFSKGIKQNPRKAKSFLKCFTAFGIATSPRLLLSTPGTKYTPHIYWAPRDAPANAVHSL